jgi:hypothetical protein
MVFCCTQVIDGIAALTVQTPIQIQCVQSADQESWAKWLLPTIVQTIVSLASITAGVSIAVWSFRKNRQAEHEQWTRNRQAARNEWVRDQKRVEWRELLGGLNSLYFPIALAQKMGQPLPIESSQRLLELSKCFRDRVFIDGSIQCHFMPGLLTARPDMTTGMETHDRMWNFLQN